MSIATEITRLQTVKQNIRSALVDKGVAAAATHDMGDFPQDIAGITTADPRLAIALGKPGALDLSDQTDIDVIRPYKFSGMAVGLLPTTGKLTSFVFPPNVLLIGQHAFEYQSQLSAITLPTGVQEIQDNAFYQCSALKTIQIPSSVITLGTAVFQSSGLETANIQAQVTAIPMTFFRGCEDLTSVTFPSNLTEISSYAFYGCKKFNQNLPATLQTIGTYAFYDCSALNPAEIPASVKAINNYAFYDCVALAIDEIPSGVTTIGSNAFQRCTSLTEMDLPATITSIGASAFSGCSSLEKVKIRAQKFSGSSVFSNCTALTNKVWISSDCTTIAASTTSSGPFQSSSITDIYCEAASKPSGWGTYWNRRSSSQSITVHWGTTEADFDALT